MRLLFICNEYPPAIHGGVGTFVLTLAQQLAENKHEVFVIGFDESLAKHISQDENGVRVMRLASPFKNRASLQWGRYDIAAQILKRMYLSQKVRSFCRQQKIDLVESYDWNGPLWFHPGVPLLVRMHGAHSAYALYENRRSPRFIAYIEKKNLRMANALVGVSRHISEWTLKAAGLEHKPFDVIYNGVDTSMFHPKKDVERSNHEVLFAGTVARRKGIYELFAALPLVMRAVPMARFNIVGRLPAEKHEREKLLKELLSNIPTENRSAITFNDARPYSEMPLWYSRAACAVFPSLAEAYGLTCAEAMACGTPVIMTARASGPEIVEHGVSGWLCEPTDRQALADTIISLLQKPNLRKTLSLNAEKRIKEKFEANKVFEKNITVYKRLQETHD